MVLEGRAGAKSCRSMEATVRILIFILRSLGGLCRFKAEGECAHWQRRNAHKETAQVTLNSVLDSGGGD